MSRSDRKAASVMAGPRHEGGGPAHPDREGEGEGDEGRGLPAPVLQATAVACLGGVMFGYDLGVISGALPSLSASLALTDGQSETVVAMLFVGSVVGSVFGGIVCDALGRRTSVLACDGVFLLASLLLAFAPSYGFVLVGRIVVGVAVSLSAIADVSYLTEIAPDHHRGALVSCHEASIGLGFLISYLSSYAIAAVDEAGSEWRVMFGLSGLIALLQFALMRSLPESPPWLAGRGRAREAAAALVAIRGPEYATSCLGRAGESPPGGRSEDGFDNDPDNAADFDPVGAWDVVAGDELGHIPPPFGQGPSEGLGEVEEGKGEGGAFPPGPGPRPPSRYWRRAAIALFLGVAQQLTGHANVLNFAPEILSQTLAGDQNGDAEGAETSLLMATIALGVVKFLLTAFTVFKVDRIGRRFLLLSGVAIIAASLLCVIAGFSLSRDFSSIQDSSPAHRYFVFVGCIGVVAGYSLSFGPLTWLIASEIFPPHVRGRALGLTTAVSNATAAIMSYTFLTGQDLLGPAIPFALYFAFTICTMAFAWTGVPDTGDVAADGSGGGEDLDDLIDSMVLWRQPCCQPGGCLQRRTGMRLPGKGDEGDEAAVAGWHRRRQKKTRRIPPAEEEDHGDEKDDISSALPEIS